MMHNSSRLPIASLLETLLIVLFFIVSQSFAVFYLDRADDIVFLPGGWWFDNCFQSNLNGVWRGTAGDVGMGWYYWQYASHPRFEGSEMAVTRDP